MHFQNYYEALRTFGSKRLLQRDKWKKRKWQGWRAGERKKRNQGSIGRRKCRNRGGNLGEMQMSKTEKILQSLYADLTLFCLLGSWFLLLTSTYSIKKTFKKNTQKQCNGIPLECSARWYHTIVLFNYFAVCVFAPNVVCEICFGVHT